MSVADETLTNELLCSKDKEFLEAVKGNNIHEVKQVIGHIDINCHEEDGMTALMHASYKGNAIMVEYLLSNGASQSCNNTQKDGYTALMFATLAGSTEVVQMLLEAGAKADVVNKVNRTAAQLGAFVGRHNCVTLINNFVEKDNVKYYTKKHGLQEEAKLKEHVAAIVHKYMLIPNLNPVKMIFFIQKNKELITNYKSVSDVLESECGKNFKKVNEILSLKLHFLSCVLKKAKAWDSGEEGKGGLEGLLKFLLKGRPEDGFLVNIETLLRDCIKSFPYSQSNIFQQLVRVLSKVHIGNEPSALSTITQSLNGIQSADFSECCVCCGEPQIVNKCSVCKMVRYCELRCQKLHWSTHKQFCREMKKQFEIMQEEKKKAKESEQSENCIQEPDLNALNINEDVLNVSDNINEIEGGEILHE